MEEIDARQGGRDDAAFLIDVVALAWHIRIVADDGERTGAGRNVGPGQLRLQILAEADVMGGIGDSEG